MRILSSSRRRACRASRAFSILELLLVVAGLLVVLALAFPAIGRLNQSSRQARCGANLRQLGILMFNYLADHRGVYPRSATQLYDADGAPSGASIWTDAVVKHAGLRDLSVFICPEVKDVFPALSENLSVWAYPSYGINRYGVAPDASDTAWRPANQLLMEAAAATLLLVDFDHQNQPWDGWYSVAQVNLTSQDSSGVTGFKRVAKRHGGTLTALFCDGHVETLSEEALARPGTQAPWREFQSITKY